MSTGDHLRDSGPMGLLFKRGAGAPVGVILLSILILSSIGIQTMASPPSRTATANCNSCHSSSFFLYDNIRSVVPPSSIQKNIPTKVDVTVEVFGSHRSSSWCGFGMDVWLTSSSGNIATGRHQIINGQVPTGSSSPYSWLRTYAFWITGSQVETDTITVKAKMSPIHESPPVTDTDTFVVDVMNSPPVLNGGSVAPSTGGDNAGFDFSVNFTDQNNDPPSYIRIVIDDTDTHDLLDLASGDGSTKKGEDFGISDIMLAVGDHSFFFEASDGTSSTRFPAIGVMTGPSVYHVNVPPRLEDPSVDPPTGGPDDEFTYHVTYYDEEGSPPSEGVKLLLDGGSRIVNMELDLSALNILRDGNYTNGESYIYSTNLIERNHDYGFNASDGEKWIEIGPFLGPVVSVDPILQTVINSPAEGEIFYEDEEVTLNGSYSSNVEPTDALFRWTSNIYGILGSSSEVTRFLPVGIHTITFNARSEEHSLSSNSLVNITVIERVEEAEPPLVIGRSPEDDARIAEGENLTFSVILNAYHPVISRGATPSYRWSVNGGLLDFVTEGLIFRTGYLDSGLHYVELNVSVEDVFAVVGWNVTVRNRAAPILVIGEIPKNLGDFQKKDILQVSLPLEDPEGRDLSVKWTIEGTTFEREGVTFSLDLRGGNWAHEGAHDLTALVKNSDGSSMLVTIGYNVLPDIAVDDDESDDDIADDDVIDEEDEDKRALLKDDPAGVAVIVIGALAVLAGVVYSIYAVASPIGRKMEKREVDRED